MTRTCIRIELDPKTGIRARCATLDRLARSFSCTAAVDATSEDLVKKL